MSGEKKNEEKGWETNKIIKKTVETRKKYTPSLTDNYKRQSSEDKFQFLHKALNSL